MSKVGIYPGTFDPITNGHIDIIKRSLKIVDKLIVAVSGDYSKDYLFSADERVTIIKNSLFKDLKIKAKKLGELPEWHLGYKHDGRSWIFVDEISIR